MKIQIKSFFSSSVLFEFECEDNSIKLTLEAAIKSNADLICANLRDANLRDAYLSGANLRDEIKTIGQRPCFSIGPIGSRRDTLFSWVTNKGLMLQVGCFFGSKDEFLAALSQEHGDNKHADEYKAALLLAEKHAELWEDEE